MARFRSFACLVSGAVFALAGCQRTGAPAPFELHTGPGPPTLSEKLPIHHPDRVVVQSGDTLYGLSRRWGVPMRAIIDANYLTPPFRLIAGSSLALPQVRTHLVRPGDTLAGVARAYGVDESTLASTNHLAPPYIIRTGETLVLPARVEADRRAAPPAPRRTESVPAASPSPVLAVAPPPPPTPLARPAETTKPAAPAVAPVETSLSRPPERPPAPVLSLPPVSDKGFIWPVRGRIVAAYGTGPQGTHNDGINIAAPAGTPVLAAESGEVAYVGNELRGYGNLILIKHPNGFITAYAHNQKPLVRRGEHVHRGQMIARVGATGAVGAPQLHFEIRRGTRVLDPDDYLPAQTATARP